MISPAGFFQLNDQEQQEVKRLEALIDRAIAIEIGKRIRDPEEHVTVTVELGQMPDFRIQGGLRVLYTEPELADQAWASMRFDRNESAAPCAILSTKPADWSEAK